MTNDTPSLATPAIAEGSGSERPGWWSRGVRRLATTVSADMARTVATSFVLFGLFALQGIVLARMLGPEGRGQYATIVFYSQTLTFVGLLGTQHAIARWAARRRGDAPALFRVAMRSGAFTGLFTMLIVTGLALFVLPAEKRSLAPWCLLASLFLPLEHVRQLWLSLDHGLRRFSRYNTHRLVGGLALPSLLAAVWFVGAGSVAAACCCFVLAPLMGLAYRWLAEEHVGQARIGRTSPSVGALLHRGRTYAAAVLASDLFERLDVFLFLWLASFTAQGFYAAAVPAAGLLSVLPLAFSLFAFNAGADRAHRPSLSGLARAGISILAVQVAAAVVFAIVIESLIVLVYGESFRGAVPFAKALIPAYAVAGVGRVTESYLQGRNRALVGAYARCLAAGAMLLAVWCAYGRWGEISIPFGLLLGNCLSTAVLLIAVVVDVQRGSGVNGRAVS